MPVITSRTYPFKILRLLFTQSKYTRVLKAGSFQVDNKLMFKFMKIYYIHTLIKYIDISIHIQREISGQIKIQPSIQVKLINRIFFLLDNECLNNFSNRNDLYIWVIPSYKCLQEQSHQILANSISVLFMNQELQKDMWNMLLRQVT